MADQTKVMWNEAVYPLAGTFQPHARVGAATVRFDGATGLVATVFGIPGISATRLATGHYRVAFPRSPARSIKCQATPVHNIGTAYQGQGPTGIGFSVQLANRSAPSGTIEMILTRGQPSAPATNLALGVPVNPPALSEVDLLLFITPIIRF